MAQNRVNTVPGQTAYFQGQRLGGGQFLGNEVTSYWIETFVPPTAAQREAGRTHNIPLAVPVNANWSKSRIQRAVGAARAAARAAEFASDVSENVYQVSVDEDAADRLLWEV